MILSPRLVTIGCAGAVVLILTAAPADAQPPRGSDSISVSAAAESLAVLRRLDSTVTKSPNDAAAWFHRGMIAWALSVRARAVPPVPDLDWTLLGRLADTSLRIAAQLDSQNATYRMTIGRFLLATGVPITRTASEGFFQDALTVARAGTDSAILAETALEVGRFHWRRYDALANRRMEIVPGSAIRSLSQAMQPASSGDELPGSPQSLESVRQALDLATQALPLDAAGKNDFDAAELLFREAYRVAPDNPKAFRQLAMSMLDAGRWGELASLARGKVGRAPWDPVAWMTLGLANHRQGLSRAAAAAFDSAAKLMSPQDLARFDRIERVIRKTDLGTLSGATPAERQAKLRLYWLFADPLWSREGNESRIEFLARVTFADLRWTVDELGVRGADTDRGDVFIRYGPPDVIAGFGAGVTQGTAEVTWVWVYARGFMFTFSGASGFGTARVPLEDRAFVEAMAEAQPVRWDNISEFTIDSMVTQVARFRARGDSVDLFIAVDPPVARIQASSDVRVTPRADFWLLKGGTIGVKHDSATLAAPGVRSWTTRLAPANYVYRIEASADGASRAARAVAPIVTSDDPTLGIPARGFAISDLVLASSAVPRRGATGRRWSDLQITPIIGRIAPRGELTLVWENYEFGRDSTSGNSRYTIAVTIERERSTGGRIAARILGGLAGVVGADRTDDRMTIRIERAVGHVPALADNIGIALEDTPAGSYRLTLEITDQITGRALSRGARFTIGP